MNDESEAGKPIWAKWRVLEDGQVVVAATYRRGDRFVQRETSFTSLAAAAEALGRGFADVVKRAMEAGSLAGRWRP